MARDPGMASGTVPVLPCSCVKCRMEGAGVLSPEPCQMAGRGKPPTPEDTACRGVAVDLAAVMGPAPTLGAGCGAAACGHMASDME